jgi:glycosyltransferase involved in cell wall biosynthesis
MPGLSVILPRFDQRIDVADAIRAAIRTAARISDEYEVIVVDDGSTDGTAAVARRFVRTEQPVRLIVHSGHQGYGAALRSGIKAAGMPWVLLTDGDVRIGPRGAEDFLSAARRSDLVVGWRVMRQDRVGRRAHVAAWNRLVTRGFGLTMHDPDCPLKLVRRDLLDRVELSATDAMVGTELLVKCTAAAARVSEVPFRELPREEVEIAGGAPGLARSLAEFSSLYRPLRRLRRASSGERAPRGALRRARRAPRATPG